MNRYKELQEAKHVATQALLQVVVLSAAQGTADPEITSLARTIASLAGIPSVEVSTPEQSTGLTFTPAQYKVRGAGRRPASLIGREVTVLATWQVVDQKADGTITATLAPTPAKGKGAKIRTKA